MYLHHPGGFYTIFYQQYFTAISPFLWFFGVVILLCWCLGYGCCWFMIFFSAHTLQLIACARVHLSLLLQQADDDGQLAVPVVPPAPAPAPVPAAPHLPPGPPAPHLSVPPPPLTRLHPPPQPRLLHRPAGRPSGRTLFVYETHPRKLLLYSLTPILHPS